MIRINTFSIETTKGVRSFHLCHGDICDSADDLIVASTHANANELPTGAVVRLHNRFGCDFSALQPLIVPRGCFGTSVNLMPPQGNLPSSLLFGIPGAYSVSQTTDEPLAVIREALWTLFGSLAAALDYDGQAYRWLSLPVLAGRRGYPIRDVLVLILENVVKWLRASQATEEITLYVYEAVDFTQWYDEMDAILGRKCFESAKDSVLNGLRQELVSLVRDVRASKCAGATSQGWLDELSEALCEDKLRFQRISGTGQYCRRRYLLPDGTLCRDVQEQQLIRQDQEPSRFRKVGTVGEELPAQPKGLRKRASTFQHDG